MSSHLSAGVYPDGVETEMASGYDIMTAGIYFGVLSFLEQAVHHL